jgi:hypothetical protein
MEKDEREGWAGYGVGGDDNRKEAFRKWVFGTV